MSEREKHNKNSQIFLEEFGSNYIDRAEKVMCHNLAGKYESINSVVFGGVMLLWSEQIQSYHVNGC